MKKKTLLTAILSIVMCMSLMAGATFALFTSESTVNIAITSGKVELTATVSDVYLKNLNEADYGVDRTVANGETKYFETAYSDTRTVEFDGQDLTLTNMACGDAVKFNVNVENTSTIAAKYRVIISAENNTGLFEGLVVKVNDQKFLGKTYTPWKLLSANTNGDTIGFEIELPDTGNNTHDNKFQGKACDIVVTVEGIQGNAETFDDTSIGQVVETENGAIADDTILSANGFTAKIPAGTVLVENATTASFVVEEIDNPALSNFDITGAETVNLEINIPEIADNNDKLVIVTLNSVVPAGTSAINILHRDEIMTQVASLAELDAHNEYYYDATTGSITIATKNFSEFVVILSDDISVKSEKGFVDALANGITDIKLGGDFAVEKSYKVASGKTLNIDLNGYTLSGVCSTSQGYIFMVENTAKLIINDSVGTGKITYAGNSSTGWIVDVEGELVLEAGTLELTGTWGIGYAVDVRPNAWGTAYTEGTTFTMNGGKIISSDGAVRVASSSSDTHKNVSASFVMNDGEIVAEWDGIFVQQSNAAWDVLNVYVYGGVVEGALNPIRIYGPKATSYVNGEKCITLVLSDKATYAYTGSEVYTNWIIDEVIRYGGGATIEEILADTNIISRETLNDGTVLESSHGEEDVYLCSVAEVETTEYVVPDEVTMLKSGVFSGNKDIDTVTIPASVKDFGATGVSATNASSGAFKGSNVTNVVLEEGMTEIPAAAFNGASKLVSVSIPSTVTTIGVNAFRSTAITELTVPATVTNISYGAFRDMTSLTTVTFKGTHVDIPNYAFRGCTNLRTVYIESETATIGTNMAFCNASSNNPNTNNITFYVKTAEIADQIKTCMGVGSYVAIYVGDSLYAEIK